MIKRKLEHINRDRNTKRLIRNLLNESGFLKEKIFFVRKKEGIVQVRFNKKDYE